MAEMLRATFRDVRAATSAIDWFRNQAIAPEAIGVLAVPPGGAPRPPQAGDNRRTDLGWIVSLDLSRAHIPKSVALATFRREGGKV